MNIRRLAVLIAFLCSPIVSRAGEGHIRHFPNGIKGHYIVVLNDLAANEHIPDIANELARVHRGNLEHVWQRAIRGFSIEMPEARAEAMSHDPRIAYVEEDAPMYLSSQMPTNVDPATCDLPTPAQSCPAVDDDRIWHLDRLDQVSAVPSNQMRYCSTGNGVYIYLIDTGVVGAHTELASRVLPGYNASGDSLPADDPCFQQGMPLDPADDQEAYIQYYYTSEWAISGHGTATASIAAGRKVGVAKSATVVPVKVWRCDKYSSRRWQANHYYYANKRVAISWVDGQPRYQFRCVTPGTSGAVAPNWSSAPSVGNRITEPNGPTWENERILSDGEAATTSMTIDGLNWVIGDTSHRPAVVSMSIFRSIADSGASSIDTVVRNVIAANIPVIASANNQNDDACHTTPGRLSRDNPNPQFKDKVITVGGSMIVNAPNDFSRQGLSTPARGGNNVDQTEPVWNPLLPTFDARWICGAGDSDACSGPPNTYPPANTYQSPLSYTGLTYGSNWGPCVTLFAPARNMPVANIRTMNDYRDPRIDGSFASGTSWSAPYVAGLAARAIEQHPSWTASQRVDEVYDAIMASALSDVFDPATLNPPAAPGQPQRTDTPNLLAHTTNLFLASAPPAVIGATPSATLAVTLYAPTPPGVTYQWYQVNAGFDLQHNHSGAAGSTPISGQTSNTITVTPAQVTGYWCRVTSNCCSVETDISVVVPATTAPTGLQATFTGGSSVNLSWNAVPGADMYAIDRKWQGSGGWQELQQINSQFTSASDVPPATAAGMYLYRIRSLTGWAYGMSPLVSSTPSLSDVANVNAFSDDPIATGTLIRSRHLAEVRRAVNGFCDAAGLARRYADTAVTDGFFYLQPLRAAEWNELRATINAVRTDAAVNMPAFSFTDTLASMTTIKPLHLDGFRSALK